MAGYTTLKLETSKPGAGLYIVATPIGNLKDITLRGLEVLAGADIIVCEDTRITHRLLDHYGIKASMLAYNDGNGEQVRPQILRHLEDGKAVALVSDAGTPLISDPGYKLVREVVERGFSVSTLPGASAVLGALTLAGLPTNRFVFEGFLPVASQSRKAVLHDLKTLEATLVFYERASRLAGSLQDMAEVLGARQAAVVRELTKRHEEAVRGTLPELAGRYAEAEPKGEIVIVVGTPVEEAAGQADVDALLASLLEKHSVKDAVALTAEKLGLPKKVVYQRALELK